MTSAIRAPISLFLSDEIRSRIQVFQRLSSVHEDARDPEKTSHREPSWEGDLFGIRIPRNRVDLSTLSRKAAIWEGIQVSARVSLSE